MPFFNQFIDYTKSKVNTVANSLSKVMDTKSIQGTERIHDCGRAIHSLLSNNEYVARSMYSHIVSDYSADISALEVLSNSGMLTEYCKKKRLDKREIKQILYSYSHIHELIDEHNKKYIADSLNSEKAYFDNILKDVDPNIALDEDQRRVILDDEDYSLVIAGAGAGKTTTIAAKVKYLVEKKGVDPEKILVVSFTNKAVTELKERLNDALQIPCPIATFHSTGYAIMHRHNPERMNIVEESKVYWVIMNYFRSEVLRNESMTNNLIRFFASYFDAPYEGTNLYEFFNQIAKANFTTMRSDLENFKEEVMENRTKKKITIQSEMLRSFQEVEIANFLYLNNIDYKYEPIYKYNIPNSRKPYTPDFVITQGDTIVYIEHFGVTEEGKNDRYSEAELEFYKQAINDKIELHKKHGSKLIYTFSAYKDHRSITDHLKEQLEEAGIELSPRSQKEIMEKLVSTEESRYVRRLVWLICRFISNFKINGYTQDDFNRMFHSTTNVRTRLFLDICNDCYLHYQRFLKENNAVDFQDMINESARLLREVKELGKQLDFKYLIIDEYQDISRQRFDLVRALSDVTDAKVIAVGDDWQSIYAFNGSDITLFTKFAEKMGYASLLKIENTYRNSQEVIAIAGNFIQKNEQQIKKTLHSPKHIDRPVIIYTYSPQPKENKAEWRSGVNYAIAAAVERALVQILVFNEYEKQGEKHILLLGRFGFDADHLERSGLFEYDQRSGKIKSVKYPNLDITFMTAHSSKGLGFDEVIVINGKNETYGFPAKIEDDPVLSLVIKEDRSIDYAEERRLFYVAMTRTKNRVYFIAPEKNPSEFLLELKTFFKDVELVGNWSKEPPQSIAKKKCPICGYPMQLRFHRSYGLRLYICTNEPEICGFMTNEINGGKLAIMKCDECRDGYLVVKRGKNDNPYFLGCTNYKHDGTGCNRVIAKKYYYEMMHYAPDPEPQLQNVDSHNTKKESLIISEDKRNDSAKNKVTLTTSTTVPGIDLSSIEIVPKTYGVVYKEHDLGEVLPIILMCVVHISQIRFYGIFVLNEVLRGNRSDKILKAKLDNVPEFGKLSWLSANDLTIMIRWLIDNHFLFQTKGDYPVLHITADTAKFNELVTAEMLNYFLIL